MERWNSLASPFDLLDRDLPQLFRRLVGDAVGAQATRSWMPSLNVFTREGELHVQVELPGVDPAKDVEVEVVEGRMTIRGDRRRDESVSDGNWWRHEMSFGHFERTVVLPSGVDASAVSARYDAGILDVTIPMPKPQASKVPIAIGEGSRSVETGDGG